MSRADSLQEAVDKFNGECDKRPQNVPVVKYLENEVLRQTVHAVIFLLKEQEKKEASK